MILNFFGIISNGSFAGTTSNKRVRAALASSKGLLIKLSAGNGYLSFGYLLVTFKSVIPKISFASSQPFISLSGAPVQNTKEDC